MIVENRQYETRTKIEEKVLKTYRYGSRVYGCNTEKSDYDFIMVVESDNPYLYYNVNNDHAGCNFTIYSEQMFLKRMDEHHISVLECVFQDSYDKYVKQFVLDKAKLRKAISSVASNSYIKCKKKLRDGEEYIGLKSLFHSLRILNFGIQIALYGKIVNYKSANVFLKMIMDIGADWEKLNAKFKPIFNSMKSLFKKLAPLESEMA